MGGLTPHPKRTSYLALYILSIAVATGLKELELEGV